MDYISVAIVEDHDIFRKRLAELLGFYEEIELRLVASSAEDFFEKLEKNGKDRNPDVVLMDIELPGISGIDATCKLNEQDAGINVIMFTVFEDDDRIFESIKVGASGYLLKDTPIDTVVQSIQEIQKGGSPISPEIAAKVFNMMRAGKTKADSKQRPFDLTPAEIRILEQVVDGKSNKEIAEILFLSPWTIKTHIKNMYKKMHVNSRAAAVRLALKRDID